jgi:hypothetical protein
LKPTSKGKGKQVLGEEEHVYARNIKAHKPGVPFVNLSSSELAGRFNRASRCLVSQENMDFLDSMNPAERMQKAQSAMAEVRRCVYVCPFLNLCSLLMISFQGLIRMLFETSKIQQNEVDQETIRTLTSRIDEQNDKVADLYARLEKCKGLTEHLDLAEN